MISNEHCILCADRQIPLLSIQWSIEWRKELCRVVLRAKVASESRGDVRRERFACFGDNPLQLRTKVVPQECLRARRQDGTVLEGS